jgi:hypothetical protein
LLSRGEGTNMESKSPKTGFWVAFATINVVALGYASNLVLQANDEFARVAGALAYIGIVFLLVISDAVSVLMAYWE